MSIVQKIFIKIVEIKIYDDVVNDYGKIIDIIPNQEQIRCFIIYSGFNTTELKEIDLKTGKYLMTIPILTPLVEKIRIVGNAIYYITRTDGVNGDERCLFKQKLD